MMGPAHAKSAVSSVSKFVFCGYYLATGLAGSYFFFFGQREVLWVVFPLLFLLASLLLIRFLSAAALGLSELLGKAGLNGMQASALGFILCIFAFLAIATPAYFFFSALSGLHGMAELPVAASFLLSSVFTVSSLASFAGMDSPRAFFLQWKNNAVGQFGKTFTDILFSPAALIMLVTRPAGFLLGKDLSRLASVLALASLIAVVLFIYASKMLPKEVALQGYLALGVCWYFGLAYESLTGKSA